MSVWEERVGCFCNLFCICAYARSLRSASLRSRWQAIKGMIISQICHFDRRKSLIFVVEKSFLFSLLTRLLSWAECNEVEGSPGILLSILTKRVARSAWRNLCFTFCGRFARSLGCARDDRQLRKWLSPSLSFRPEKIFDFWSGEI